MIERVSNLHESGSSAHVWRERRGLYAIVDADALGGRDAVEFARRLLDAGDLFALQWRAKSLTANRMLEVAEALAQIARSAHGPFVVNDRPDVARLARADAVHVGQDDLPMRAVREISGGAFAIGCSTHDESQFARALADAPDYIAFGPVFDTQSKQNPDAVVGLVRLASVVCTSGGIPVVAIGGISLERASVIRETGVAAAAIIGALHALDGADITTRARSLHQALGGR